MLLTVRREKFMLFLVSPKSELADFVRRVLFEKGLSTYDVQKASDNGISAATVTKIINGDIRSSSIETLAALAKGLGVPEDRLFRVARGLPADVPTDKAEILAEAFDGRELSDADWQEIEAVIKVMVVQRKAIRSAAEKREKPAPKSKRRK